jgi:uncharacterized protein
MVPLDGTNWYKDVVPVSRQGTPFPFEGPVPPELLIDRHEELDLLARRAGDRVNVRLAAPRRYGKTSLLLAHARRLQATDWRAVHVDLSRAADLADVARRIAAGYAPLDISWVRAHLSTLLSRLGVSLSATGPTVTLTPRPHGTETEAAEAVLLRLLDLPRALWEADGTPTLVVFDEFQDLLVARKDLDGLLRSRIQYHGDAAAYVFAGSEPSMLRELFDRRERPFFGQADPVALDPLPVDEVLTDLATRFADEHLDPGDALGELAAFAAGHPQRTMLLCYLLSDRLVEGADPTPSLASEVISDAVQRTEPAHQALWGQLSSTERVVLAAVADGIPPTSRALAAEHKLGRNALNAAADRLVNQGHLIRRPSPAQLVDPLLAEWLRRR